MYLLSDITTCLIITMHCNFGNVLMIKQVKIALHKDSDWPAL